jgi:hypothetical protein
MSIKNGFFHYCTLKIVTKQKIIHNKVEQFHNTELEFILFVLNLIKWTF